MKALPWIILIVAVIVIVYFVYNKRKAEAASTFVPPVPAPVVPTLRPTTNPNQNQAPESTAEVPAVVSGSSLAGASCLNTPTVVNLIKSFKESKAYQLVLRMQIKDTMGAICPEGLRYLVR